MYTPSKKVLERYAHVLVNFALGGGTGIKKGDVVYVVIEEAAKPLYIELRKAILQAGGHIIANYIPSNSKEHNFSKDFYLYADHHQLDFFPDKHLRGLIDQMDHMIAIISETDKKALADIDPQKLMRRGKAMKQWMDWRRDKENAGKFTWTIALYGTPAMAKEAKLSLKDYWQQIINACFLNKIDPVAEWKNVYKQIDTYEKKLNSLPIDKLHIEGKDADLWITLGERRAWKGGSGRNIPSFEIFTSPDWRGTNGWIKFNQPLYRYGNLIDGIELEFKDGVVLKSKAKKNEKVLKEMIATEGANKVGEFSLTDARFSRITKFMAETLFDENIGGKYGNTHIALGSAYHDCFAGNPAEVSKETWKELGYNDSSVHTDIVSTTDRTVTAVLSDGTEKVIYTNGQFTL